VELFVRSSNCHWQKQKEVLYKNKLRITSPINDYNYAKLQFNFIYFPPLEHNYSTLNRFFMHLYRLYKHSHKLLGCLEPSNNPICGSQFLNCLFSLWDSLSLEPLWHVKRFIQCRPNIFLQRKVLEKREYCSHKLIINRLSSWKCNTRYSIQWVQ